jgi:hypothetical protein
LKTIAAQFEIQPDKETKGCYRYRYDGGDHGVATIYIRKEAFGDDAPRRLSIVITEQ